MGGKVSVLTLNADMTFKEQKKKTDINNVEMSKHNKPDFIIGRSVFRELLPLWKRKILGKKPRNLIIYFEGATSCFHVTDEMTLQSHERDIWSRKEKEKYINKLATKSKAEQKAIETWQFLVLMGIGIISLVIQFVILSGVPIRV